MTNPHTLLDKYFEETLTSEEEQSFRAWLLSDQKNAEALVAEGHMRRTIHDCIEAEQVGHCAVFPSRWMRRFSRLAAGIVILLASLWGIHRMRYPTIARLTSVSGDVVVTYNSEPKRAVAGKRLCSGTEVHVADSRGAAQITWNDGSFMTVNEHARFTLSEIDGQRTVQIAQGRLGLDARKQPADKPFVLASRDARIEVLGTRVYLRANRAGSGVEVEEGHVRMERLSDGRTVDLFGKHGLRVDDDSDLTPERFYWADRYIGSRAGKGDSSHVLQQTEGYEVDRQRYESRFKGARGRRGTVDGSCEGKSVE